MPDRARPYQAFLHPLPAILCAISSLVVLGVTILDRDLSVLVAVAWFAVALLFFRFVLARR